MSEETPPSFDFTQPETNESEPTETASEPKPETELVDTDYFYPAKFDPQRRNLPQTSVYLDDEQRRLAEIDRARVEGREPDLDNPPATAGTPLYNRAELASHNPVPEGYKADVTLPVVRVVE